MSGQPSRAPARSALDDGKPERTVEDARRWVTFGTELLTEALQGADDGVLGQPSLLPGWSRAQVVGHVAANGAALGNLIRWAQTGVETPMYASPEQRLADIQRSATMSAVDLAAWLGRSAAELEVGMDALAPQQWQAPVVTAQGRTVPATEVPWLRAREVCVHAVDLDLGVGFEDLPDDYLRALAADVAGKRGDVPAVEAPLDQAVAYLTGRPHDLAGLPALPPWL